VKFKEDQTKYLIVCQNIGHKYAHSDGQSTEVFSI